MTEILNSMVMMETKDRKYREEKTDIDQGIMCVNSENLTGL